MGIPEQFANGPPGRVHMAKAMELYKDIDACRMRVFARRRYL